MKVFIGGHRVLRVLSPFRIRSVIDILNILVRFVVRCNRRVRILDFGGIFEVLRVEIRKFCSQLIGLCLICVAIRTMSCEFALASAS